MKTKLSSINALFYETFSRLQLIFMYFSLGITNQSTNPLCQQMGTIQGAFKKNTVSSSLVQLVIGLQNTLKHTFSLQLLCSAGSLSFETIKEYELIRTCSLFNHLQHGNFTDIGGNTV